MSDENRTPVIRLPIDQEVPVETVTQGDQLEDATVATEIVSFDRDGDAYVLEGAIVFAAYVHRTEGDAEAAGPDVAHVHHRLPFTLRVPMNAQTRGIVNVKSRLAAWDLEVMGDGWIRVKGNLDVGGLYGTGGYYFTCGAQQAGNYVPEFTANEQSARAPSAFEPAWRGAEDDSDEERDSETNAVAEEEESLLDPARHDEDDSEAQPVEQEADEDVRSMYRGGSDEADDSADLRSHQDVVSHARHGHEWQAAEEGSAKSDARTRDELANLDRYITPKSEDGLENRHEVPFSSEITSVDENAQSFEFENQLNPDERSTAGEVSALPREASHLARSIRDFEFDGQEAATPVLKFSASMGLDDPADESPEVDDQDRDTRSKSLYDQSMWSFVDFNVPDKSYTLRYVIVTEEETLETVADRVGVTRTELCRVNRLEDEGFLRSGQALLVPEVAFRIGS